MIQLKISGRTGNQLFQYAFVNNYIIHQKLENEKIHISLDHLNKFAKTHGNDSFSFENELSYFDINNIETIPETQFSFNQKILDIIYKVFIKIIRKKAKMQNRVLAQKDYDIIIKYLQKPMNKNGLYYYIPGMKDFYKSKTPNLIFFGSYEDFSYYEEDRETLMKIYTPKYERIESNQFLYNDIETKNSVCVTIRRGDFLSDINRENYYICNGEYFKKAMEQMSQLVPNAQYIVFSDDVEWCKENIEFPEGTKFETGKDPIWEKLRLMYSCKNFIISNSTFSWWVQFLSRNDNKIVIAPKKWNNFEYCDLIYDKSWKLI